uniref:Uncharacterized protein n=1 Tax=Pithovirus LCPAC201 TaxID=2506591 RepID=A0A481Z7Z4_9VIRU|nr:MAG: hypothetical protein LCPAC201_01320 [Pithovirus LCPAC201]
MYGNLPLVINAIIEDVINQSGLQGFSEFQTIQTISPYEYVRITPQGTSILSPISPIRVVVPQRIPSMTQVYRPSVTDAVVNQRAVIALPIPPVTNAVPEPIITNYLPEEIRPPEPTEGTVSGQLKTYGYRFTFIKPHGDVRFIIDKLPKKRRNQLLVSMTGSKDIDILLRQNEWTLSVDSCGTIFLIKLFLAFQDWDGWTLSPETPVSIEGIYGLTLKELKAFGRKFKPKIRVGCNTKTQMFERTIDRMMEDRLIIDSERKLVCPALFKSLRLVKADILKIIPSSAGVKKLSRIHLSFHHVLFLRKIENLRVSPQDLVEMDQKEWLKLAIEEKIVNQDRSFVFSNLVKSLVKSKRLQSDYAFVAEDAFWQFYQKYYHHFHKIGAIYDKKSDSKAKIALGLFMDGVFSIDLEPNRLELLKSVKSLNDIPTRFGSHQIPGYDTIPTPKRIITPEIIISHSNLTDQDLINQDLIRYIRETDLLFYDAVNPAPPIENIERSTVADGPSSYLVKWKVPKHPTPYHYLKTSHINEILISRLLKIPSSIEGKRFALEGLDRGNPLWQKGVLKRIVVSMNDPARDVTLRKQINELNQAEIYYLAGHLKINILNSSYHPDLIQISIRLILGGLNPQNMNQESINLTINPKNEPPNNSNSLTDREIIVLAIESRQIQQINKLSKESIWKTTQEANREITDLIQRPVIISSSLYCDLKNLTWTSIMLLVEILYPGNLKAIVGSEQEHLFLLSRGYLLSTPTGEVISRYQKIAKLSPDQKKLLLRFYGFPYNRLTLIKLALKPQSIIDQYIIDHNLSKLIEVLGIAIPPGINENEYIMENIHSYRLIVNRSSDTVRLLTMTDPKTLSMGNICRLTDNEIISSSGVRPVFTDRVDLINKIRQLWSDVGFFESISRASFNKETLLLSKVSDPEVLMVGYGRLDNYRCYELAELHGSFHLGKDVMVHFRKPDKKTEFELDEIINLDVLVQDFFLRSVGNPDRLAELHTRIGKGIIDYREMDDGMRKIYRQVTSLNLSTKNLLKIWLRELFEAGMYMRRWKGPGNPYPHTRDETRQGDNPCNSDNMSPLGKKIGLLQEMVKTIPDNLMKIMKKLKIAGYNSETSRYRMGERSLTHIFQRVASNNFCIRVASRMFTLSAAYYLQAFFSFKIKEFYPERITKIS